MRDHARVLHILRMPLLKRDFLTNRVGDRVISFDSVHQFLVSRLISLLTCVTSYLQYIMSNVAIHDSGPSAFIRGVCVCVIEIFYSAYKILVRFADAKTLLHIFQV